MDGNLFILPDYAFPATEQNYTDFITNNFGALASTVSSAYSLAAFNSTPYPAYFAIATIYTDWEYLCPAYRGLLRATEKNIPAWTYLWDHDPSCVWLTGIPSDPDTLALLGPTHTSEIPFVFGNLDNLPLPNGTCNSTAAERQFSADFIAAYTSMADAGNPNVNARIQWPQFTANGSLGLTFGNTSATSGVVDYSRCAFWDKINTALNADNATSSTGVAASGTATASAGSSATSTAQSAAASNLDMTGVKLLFVGTIALFSILVV
jgi:carboxylesterase type B